MGTASASVTPAGGTATAYNELDYCCGLRYWGSASAPTGNPTYVLNTVPGTNNFGGNVGSNAYASAIDLETSNGVEISGLNAEEQVMF